MRRDVQIHRPRLYGAKANSVVFDEQYLKDLLAIDKESYALFKDAYMFAYPTQPAPRAFFDIRKENLMNPIQPMPSYPLPPVPAAAPWSQPQGLTVERAQEILAETKAREKAAAKQAKEEAKKAAAARAAVLAADAIREAEEAARQALDARLKYEQELCHATRQLLMEIRSLVINGSAQPTPHTYFARFRKELQPLASTYGVKLVLIGMGQLATLVIA